MRDCELNEHFKKKKMQHIHATVVVFYFILFCFGDERRWLHIDLNVFCQESSDAVAMVTECSWQQKQKRGVVAVLLLFSWKYWPYLFVLNYLTVNLWYLHVINCNNVKCFAKKSLKKKIKMDLLGMRAISVCVCVWWSYERMNVSYGGK